MPGVGITFEQVAIAANQILSQGQNPTIEKIRIHLGSGSNTTINKHLTVWRNQQNQISEGRATPPDIVKMAAEQAWLEIRKDSDAKIDAIKEESAAMILEAEDRAKLAEESEQRLRIEVQEIKEKYRSELAEKELIKLDLKKTQHELDLAMERNIVIETGMQNAQTYYTQSIQTITEAHQKEIAWLTEQFKLQEKFYKEYIDLLKSQNEESQRRWVLMLDELKEENKNLDKKLIVLQEAQQQKQIELAEISTSLNNLKGSFEINRRKISHRKALCKKQFFLKTRKE